MNSEDIIGFDALYRSMHKCQKGVLWKDSVAHYVLHGLEETLKLEEELKQGTYKARKTHKFIVTAPKRREIISVAFRDRVYQRSLNDNALYPEMTKSFIRDNWACQKGKGTQDARERMKIFLRRMYRKYGKDFYGLQIDIHNYYGSMQHKTVNRQLEKKLDAEIARRVIEVLDGQYSGETGYNPGSQMVQIVGISFLNDLDHRIAETMGTDEFGRYMDDSILFSNSIECLEKCEVEIGRVLTENGLTYNPKKTHIFSMHKGFDLLGFHFWITGTGKVVMTVLSKNVKAERKKLQRMVNKCKRGEITRKSVYDSYASWRAHAEQGDSHNLIMRMDQYLKSLWEDAC